MKSSEDLKKYALYGAVLYLLLSNAFAYNLTNNLVGKRLNSPFTVSDGCPSMAGIGAHALVYMVILVLLMMNKNE